MTLGWCYKVQLLSAVRTNSRYVRKEYDVHYFASSTNKSHGVSADVVFRDLACFGGWRCRVWDEYERLGEHA